MLLTKSENPIEVVKSDTAMKISLVVCTIAIVVVGLFSYIYNQIAAFGFGM